jgi:31-O-methyltransferase
MDYMRLPNGTRVAHVHSGETALLYRRIFADDCYFKYGVKLTPGSMVFDVGANIGMATLYFAHHCPDITVHAFEPTPEPYAALAENLRLHGIRGSSRQVALWQSPGARQFSYYPRTTLMSGLYADVADDSALTGSFLRKTGFAEPDVLSILAEKYEQRSFMAEISTLSLEIARTGVDRIDLLKLDVEKAELHVLLGIDEADWPKIRQVVAEVHDIDGRLDEFSGLLRDRGFGVTAEQEKYLEGTNVYAVFAVRADTADPSR